MIPQATDQLPDGYLCAPRCHFVALFQRLTQRFAAPRRGGARSRKLLCEHVRLLRPAPALRRRQGERLRPRTGRAGHQGVRQPQDGVREVKGGAGRNRESTGPVVRGTWEMLDVTSIRSACYPAKALEKGLVGYCFEKNCCCTSHTGAVSLGKDVLDNTMLVMRISTFSYLWRQVLPSYIFEKTWPT